jgi:actin-related protein
MSWDQSTVTINDHAIFCLSEYGRDTGLVVYSNEEATYTVPVYEGHALPDAILKLDIGTNAIADYLLLIFTEGGYPSISRSAAYDILRKLTYVALDFGEAMNIAAKDLKDEKNYELEDGTIITIHTERFRAPEILFCPSWIGEEKEGIHTQIYNSIMKCDPDIREDLFREILLAGSNTMYPGIGDRLNKEIKEIVTNYLKVIVHVPPQRGEW